MIIGMAWKDRISSDPTILRGKPCIVGTRIPVALILGYLAAKKSADEILAEVPDLSEPDIAAVLDRRAVGRNER